MRRAVAAVASAALAVLLTASPAEAKGAAALTITGPGLEAPIELRAVADGPSLSWQQLLHVTGAARMYSQLNSANTATVARPDAADLGPKYVASYELYEVAGSFVQHLYPFARPHPVAFAPAQVLGTNRQTTTAGWIEVSDDIGPLLIGLGVPRPAPLAVAETTRDGNGRVLGGGAFAITLAATFATGLLVRRRAKQQHQPLPI